MDGVDAPHSSIFELSAHVGTVLQDPDGQFIGLTVGEDIAFALENSCMPQDEMHAVTRRAAKLVGIENHLGYAPHELSGGQKQRVGLAGVMVDQVKILLFDEPLANLDPATGKQAIELIDEIQQKTDTTVLIIEHRLEDVLWRNVDRIVLVNEGKILADLRPDELLSTSLLAENGIREPLYLTALRYAGVAITPEKAPCPCGQPCAERGRYGGAEAVVHRLPAAGTGGGPGPPAGSAGSELWLPEGPADPEACRLHHRQGRDGQHRGPERRGQIHAVQAHLRLRDAGCG